MFIFFFISSLLLLSHGESKPIQYAFAIPPHKHIFILAGQSNMAGRGGVHDDKWNGYVPRECRPNRSIFQLNSKLQWEQSGEPLHANIDVHKTCGIGPGMAFANAIVARANISKVGLVPCAIGGTKIRQWARGTALYKNMLQRAKASLKGGGMIEALLWYQGESDTVLKADADSYKDNMEKFIRDIRLDLQMPTLPLIQVALASGEGSYIKKVREAQERIDLPNVSWVDAKGLALNADHLHLTTQAQVQLGNMLARAFLKQFAIAYK